MAAMLFAMFWWSNVVGARVTEGGARLAHVGAGRLILQALVRGNTNTADSNNSSRGDASARAEGGANGGGRVDQTRGGAWTERGDAVARPRAGCGALCSAYCADPEATCLQFEATTSCACAACACALPIVRQLEEEEEEIVCLNFTMIDSSSDGSAIASYYVRDVSDVPVATGTLADGANQMRDVICLDDGAYYTLNVTARGSYSSNISWAFGSISGGSPYFEWFYVSFGDVSLAPGSPPTPSPTIEPATFSPTTSPAPTTENVVDFYNLKDQIEGGLPDGELLVVQVASNLTIYFEDTIVVDNKAVAIQGGGGGDEAATGIPYFDGLGTRAPESVRLCDYNFNIRRRLFYVGPNASLRLDNVGLVNGFAAGNGGAIYSISSEVVLETVVAINNTVTGYGGVIYNSRGELSIFGGVFRDNEATLVRSFKTAFDHDIFTPRAVASSITTSLRRRQ